MLVINDVNFASDTNDNTIYDSGDSIDNVIISLRGLSTKPFQWFSDNQMKGNTNKCHFITSTNENLQTSVGNSPMESKSC